MEILRKRGPADLNKATPFEVLATAALNLSLPSTFRVWLLSDHAASAADFVVGELEQKQVDALCEGFGYLYMELRPVALSKARNREILENDFALKVMEHVSSIVTGKQYRVDPSALEWPTARVTANAAARMGEFRRYELCQDVIRVGVTVLCALMISATMQNS